MKILNVDGGKYFEAEAQARTGEQQTYKKNYIISYKLFGYALAIELVIATLSLIGNYLLSSRYALTNEDFWIMMLAPISYAVVEVSRVPLAVAFRTQDSPAIKAMALIGVLAFTTVTAKTMSQLGEMMFHPRMQAVETARRNLAEAKAEMDAYQERLKLADQTVEQKREQSNKARATYNSIIEKLGDQKEQPCLTTYRVSRDGVRSKGVTCPKNKIAEAISSQKETAKSTMTAALSELEAATASKTQLVDAKYSIVVSNAEKEVKQALFSSQLHSFTGMFYGKDSAHVSDDEVYGFMRIFVFIPSICIALAASILAATSVTRLPVEATREDIALTSGEAGVLIDELTKAAVDKISNVDAEPRVAA